jgi:hypothetical protein
MRDSIHVLFTDQQVAVYYPATSLPQRDAWNCRLCWCGSRLTGQQLKSYLKELPGKGSMLKLVSMGLQDGEPIPWTRRERWAKQIAEAVMQVHRKGFVVGALGTVDERCLLSSTIPIELFYVTSTTNFGSATLGTAAYLRNSAKISARFLVLWGLDMWRIWQPSLLGLISSNLEWYFGFLPLILRTDARPEFSARGPDVKY